MKAAPSTAGDDSTESRIGRSVARESIERTDAYLRQLDEGHPVRLSPGESDLTRNVVLNICRHRGQLDWYVGELAPKRIKARLRRMLHWALAEILWMDGLPDQVAVSVCVDTVKHRYSSREAGFVNALLRTAMQGDARETFAARLNDAPPWVQLSLPEALWKRWQARFTPAELTELADIMLRPSELCVRVRKIVGEAPFLEPEFHVPWAPSVPFRTCTDAEALFASEDWQAGRFYVQDPATLLACKMLAPQPNEEVADLCAAPGGKALVLAESLGGTGHLTCLDRSARRLRKVASNLGERKNCTLAVGDAAAAPFQPASFDAILLDVPCSNTGVIRKNPDVRWRFTEAELRSVVELQTSILNGAAPLVRPGGRLVYSTCSIEPEENTNCVAAFLASHPEFSLVEERQLLPAEHNDGAYAALLKRKIQ